MTGKIILVSSTMAALLGWGCSGGDTARVSNSSAPGSNIGGANTKGNSAPAQSDQPVPNSNIQSGSFAERSGQKRVEDAPTNGTLPPPKFSEAPEDSTITTSMKPNGQVFEIRVFKSHPQLAKVEATWMGMSQKSIKIFFRNGTMKEVTTEKIADLRSATAAEILDLAGIRQERPASTGKKPGAKSLE